jgi:pteridine reductase
MLIESKAPRVALVTGAARRVGACIARQLHAAGWNLALHARNSMDELAALSDSLQATRPGSVLMLQADLADIASLPALVEASVARFGRLDGLVNNASSFYRTPLGEVTEAQWDELFASNAKAPFFLAQAAAPHLAASGGAIVNLLDIYAERPLPEHPVYSMAKAALRMQTLALAQAMGPAVRVNGVAPGTVLWSEKPFKAETEDAIHNRTALQRVGRPEDVAEAVRFLLESANYCTGVIVAVDGGRLLST